MADEIHVLRDRIAKLEAICAMGPLISSSLDIATVVDRAMEAAERIVDAESSSVWELDAEKGELHFHFVRGGVEGALKDIRIPVGQGIVGHAVEQMKPILVEDVASDPRWTAKVDRVSGFQTRSILCLPLQVESRCIGAIQLLNKKGGGSFTEQDTQWMAFLAAQVAIALDNARFHASALKLERLQRDLDLARSIHASLFPREIPEVPGYSLAGRTEACYEIGGDYWDAVPLPDGGVLMVMADVAGKGISSALIAASFRAALRSAAGVEPIMGLAAGLNRMRHLDGQGARVKHITAFLAHLDPVQHVMTVVNAGHNPPLLWLPSGECQEIRATTLPLGIRRDITVEHVRVELPPGATLLAYTDGITESNRGDDEYGMDRLKAFLARERSREPGAMLDELWSEVGAFADGLGPVDDKTAFVLRRVDS